MDNFIFLPDRSRKNAGNSASGKLSVALGQHCTASGEYSFADGSGCIASTACSVALGNAADASNTCGFMYKDICDNTFCFDSGGQNGSAHIKINGKVWAGTEHSHGYTVIRHDSSWNNTSCSLLQLTGLSASNLNPTSRCEVTIIGAGGAGARGQIKEPLAQYPTYLSGGGGGGGCSVVVQIVGSEGWDRAGLLTLGSGGIASANWSESGSGGGTLGPAYTKMRGTPTSWLALSAGTNQEELILIGGAGAGWGDSTENDFISAGFPGWVSYGEPPSADGPIQAHVFVPAQPLAPPWSLVRVGVGAFGMNGACFSADVGSCNNNNAPAYNGGGRGGSAPAPTGEAGNVQEFPSSASIVFKGGAGGPPTAWNGNYFATTTISGSTPPGNIGGGGGGGNPAYVDTSTAPPTAAPWWPGHGPFGNSDGGHAAMFIEWWL